MWHFVPCLTDFKFMNIFQSFSYSRNFIREKFFDST
nr:MAG TPA: hypothetical protein [Caudoviricetes sp.]